MPFLSRLWHVIWILRVGLEAILLMILVRRRFYEQFPVFSLFTAWAVIQGATLLAMDRGASGESYYQTYVVGAVGGAILSFGVVYELYRRILRDYPLLSAVGNSLYRWAVLLLVATGLLLAWAAPAAGEGKLIATFYILQRTARLLQCGLLVFLFVFARSFNLSWRDRAFGIALGFGITATVSLANATIRSQIETISPTQSKDILNLISQVSDAVAAGIWIAYALARKGAGRASPGPPLPRHDLESWNQELRRLLP